MNHLPSGWRLPSLGDISDYVQRGKSPKYTDISKLPVINQKCIRWQGIDETHLKFVDPSQWPTWSPERFLRPGDILWNSTGTGTIGRAAFYKGLSIYDRAVADSHVTVVRPSSEIEGRYLQLFIKSPAVQGRMDEMQNGSTGQVELSREQVLFTEVPLPPRSEQRRIVAKIDNLSAKSNRARDHLHHVPRLLQKYRESVLDHAFEGKLTTDWRARHPNVRWSAFDKKALKEAHTEYLQRRRGSRLHSNTQISNPNLPASWIEAHLAETGNLQVGYAFKSAWYTPDGVRLLRGANIAPGHVVWADKECITHEMSEEFSKYRLEVGDIVIAMDRPVISSGLKVAIIQPQDAGCLLVQRVARFKSGPFVNHRFAWYFINSRIFLNHALSHAAGSDLPHISSNDILTTTFPLPPLDEQTEIVRLLDAAFKWIDRLNRETTSASRLIDHLDQGILAKAFCGKLVPQDPSDEPASVLLERIKAAKAGSPATGRRRGRPRAATFL